VKLDQLLIGNSRQLVQTVDVLRDQSEQLAAPLKFANRVVANVRLYGLKKLIGCLL
jgi:hypothetical protein